MSTEEVKIYTTFDSFDRAVYRNPDGAYDDA